MKNNIKKLFKNLYKQKIKLLALLTIVIFFAETMTAVNTSLADRNEAESGTVEAGNLTLTKNAESIGNDTYRINFKVHGNPLESQAPKMNVIFMIDTSGSMAEKVDNAGTRKIDKVKEAVDGFCDNLNTLQKKDIMMSIGHFDGPRYTYEYGSSRDAVIDEMYTADFSKIKAAVSSMKQKQKSYGATNTEAGIDKIGEMLKNPVDEDSKPIRKADKTYVILFTDGIPTVGIGESGMYSTHHYAEKVVTAYRSLKINNNATRFYSVGLFTKEEQKTGEALLKQINNAGMFSTQSAGNLTPIFKHISDEIKAQKNDIITKDTVIKDVIDEDFQVPDAKNLEAALKEQLKEKIASGEISNDISVSIKGREITFNFGTIKSSGVDFYFDLKPKNYYFSGTDVPTNESASIDYTNPVDEKKEHADFLNPTVEIQPKEGKITVEKLIVDDSGRKIEPSDDTTFNVLLKSSREKYNFDLSPQGINDNSSYEMSYYMRDDETDLFRSYEFTNNDVYSRQISKNYVLTGDYKVSEICPMNYRLNSIEVSYDGNSFTPIGDNGTIQVDKDHPNIIIKVKNRKVNDKYWWDNDKAENKLDYSLRGRQIE